MQTFLPHPDFETTARLLDSRRLGKQRVEAMQVLRALTRDAYGWKSHPAVLMWAGYEEALVAYGLAMCAEWRRRGALTRSQQRSSRTSGRRVGPTG